MKAKRWIHLAGGLLAIVSLVFIAQRLWDQVGERTWDVGADLLIATGVGSLIYASACLLLVSGWRRLVHLFGDPPLPFKVAASLYARSQIAKYVPGNVLHLAARHALGRSIGLSHTALGFAALGEIAGLTAAASILGIFAAGATRVGIVSWWNIGLAFSAVIVVLILPMIWELIRHWYPRLPTLDAQILRRELATVLMLYVGFFVLAGSVLVLLLSSGGGINGLHDAAASLLIFAVAWIAGFLTPGAPSGIGVREAIIVLALEKIGLGSQSLSIALLFRVATIFGDVLFLLPLMKTRLGKLE